MKKLIEEGLDEELTEEGVYVDDTNFLCNIDGSAIYIKKYPAFVHQNGAAICCVSKATEESYIIYTDSIYDILPDRIRKAIITHEIGHVQNGYIDRLFAKALELYNNGLPISTNRDLSEEINADLYACDKVGYKFVLELLDFLSNNLAEDKEEINSRISAIRSRYL